ncbi:MAG: hypothetical protein NZ839_04735 [Endomicrobia bacterium]|nr:hypothetical protein [Endomicrobiia bacterium]
MKQKFIILQVFCLFTFYITTFAQVKTQSFIDKKRVCIGDIVNYYIIIKCPSNIEIEPFEIYEVLKDTSGVENFVLLNKKYKKNKILFSKQVKHRYIFQIVPVKLGNLIIGELKLNLINTYEKQTIPIILPQTSLEVHPYPKPKKKNFDGEIIDIKPQIWVRNLVVLFLIIIIIGGVCSWIVYQYKIKPLQVKSQYLPQEIDIKELALNKLQKLWEKNYISLGLIKEFYLELSEIVRWYIGEKYQINALELTTEELFITLKKIVDKKYNIKLKSFLENADLAKFAKYRPEKTQMEQDFEVAKELII